MENEKDILVLENQIAFDFDSIETEEEEEEVSSILPESLIKPINHDYIKDEVLFVVARVYNKNLVKDFPNLKLCGKSMLDWVLLAGNDCEQKVVDDGENLLEKLKQIQTDKPYIALFYSDTPLVDKQTFYKIIDYFTSKGINFLQLSRGFIVKTEYLKTMNEFAQGSSNDIAGNNLYRVESSKDLVMVSNFLYDKIINFHIKNGVIIYGQSTVFIDADVEIEGGTVIYPNNIIEGQSLIGRGAILQSGNIIKNSILGDDCEVSNSYIENSKIRVGAKIPPLSKLINEEI